jgi:glutamine amidotransferase
MIAIIDYGVGNLFSLKSSFKAVGYDTVVTGDKDVIAKADKLILPGVGAFPDASKKLFESGLADVVKQQVELGKPLLGVCLGMQLLFSESHEYGICKGLGLIDGKVVYIDIPKEYKIPHIGWNALQFKKQCPLLKYVKEGDCVYFVHSYHAVDCENSLVATAEYSKDITAIVQKGNVFGCQFHPEKSGEVGLNILKAFCEIGE